ncbi:MAG: hypothetical protein SFZ03_02280 [Candidatus Melainabacteria bacterium]|nr:hypothetical protein [Candidatus Melainabacteria bacterium]
MRPNEARYTRRHADGITIMEYSVAIGLVVLLAIAGVATLSQGFQNGFGFIRQELNGSQSAVLAGGRTGLFAKPALARSQPMVAFPVNTGANSVGQAGVGQTALGQTTNPTTPAAIPNSSLSSTPSISGVSGNAQVGSGMPTTSAEGVVLTARDTATQARDIYEQSEALTELATNVEPYDPQMASKLRSLAYQGKVLAGTQLRLAANYADNVEKNPNVASRYEQLSLEIGRELKHSSIISGATDTLRAYVDTSKTLQTEVSTFSTLLSQTTDSLAKSRYLSAEDAQEVQALGNNILKNATITTNQNGQLTLKNSETIESCDDGQC